MGRHKKPDKLSREVSMALAAGMSYGKWKAIQDPVKVTPPKPKVCTKRICAFCGEEFVRYDKRYRKYCCEEHRIAANDQAEHERKMAQHNVANEKQAVCRSRKSEKPLAPIRLCAVCGTQITAPGRSRYCGDACSYKAHAEDK